MIAFNSPLPIKPSQPVSPSSIIKSLYSLIPEGEGDLQEVPSSPDPLRRKFMYPNWSNSFDESEDAFNNGLPDAINPSSRVKDFIDAAKDLFFGFKLKQIFEKKQKYEILVAKWNLYQENQENLDLTQVENINALLASFNDFTEESIKNQSIIAHYRRVFYFSLAGVVLFKMGKNLLLQKISFVFSLFCLSYLSYHFINSAFKESLGKRRLLANFSGL